MLLVAVAIAYLIGAVPFGVLACLPYGRDPRRVASGRIGASNVYRAAGLLPAAVTLVGDVLKGTVAVWVAGRLVTGESGGLAIALAALAAILGHNYSVYLGFRGGAGSSPNLGAALAFSPWVFLAGVLVAGAVWLGTKLASLASLVNSVVLLAGVALLVMQGLQPPAALLYGAGQLALVAWALRPNIARLVAGTEHRVVRERPADNESWPSG